VQLARVRCGESVIESFVFLLVALTKLTTEEGDPGNRVDGTSADEMNALVYLLYSAPCLAGAHIGVIGKGSRISGKSCAVGTPDLKPPRSSRAARASRTGPWRSESNPANVAPPIVRPTRN